MRYIFSRNWLKRNGLDEALNQLNEEERLIDLVQGGYKWTARRNVEWLTAGIARNETFVLLGAVSDLRAGKYGGPILPIKCTVGAEILMILSAGYVSSVNHRLACEGELKASFRNVVLCFLSPPASGSAMASGEMVAASSAPVAAGARRIDPDLAANFIENFPSSGPISVATTNMQQTVKPGAPESWRRSDSGVRQASAAEEPASWRRPTGAVAQASPAVEPASWRRPTGAVAQSSAVSSPSSAASSVQAKAATASVSVSSVPVSARMSHSGNAKMSPPHPGDLAHFWNSETLRQYDSFLCSVEELQAEEKSRVATAIQKD